MTFTLEQVIQILCNVGVDMNCAACAETAFTGSSVHVHICHDDEDPLPADWERTHDPDEN